MYRSRNLRGGLTLLELLIVLAIIIVFVALLFPAVQQSRAAALRVQSTNKLRQICFALHNYASSRDGTIPSMKNPAYYSLVPDPDPDVANDKIPLFHLLPYLDVPVQDWSPASDEVDLLRWKILPQFASIADYSLPLRQPAIPNELQFGPSSYSFNMTAFEGRPKLVESFPDGTSNTIAYIERCSYVPKLSSMLQNRPPDFLLFGHLGTPPFGIVGGSRRASFADRGFKDVIPITTDVPPVSRPSSPSPAFLVKPPIPQFDYHVPASPYNGLLVAMFDGSVHLIRPNPKDEVFWAAVTRDRGESSGGEW